MINLREIILVSQEITTLFCVILVGCVVLQDWLVCVILVGCVVLQDWLQRALCFYPPDVMLDPKLPSHLQRHLDENAMILVLVQVEHIDVR